jgi:hypothetical protein
MEATLISTSQLQIVLHKVLPREPRSAAETGGMIAPAGRRGVKSDSEF